MEIKKLQYISDSDYNKNEIFQLDREAYSVNFGTVFLKKNTRIPKEGFSTHQQDEISIIQRGKIAIIGEDGKVIKTLTAGDVICIKSREPQAGNVLEDTEIIYILAGKPLR